MTWAAPGLRDRAQVKKSPVRLDRDLAETPPPEWTADMDQVVVPGGFGFSEVDFLHKPTRTLVLTDLVVNLEPQKLPPLARPGARLVGVVAPNGKAPVYLRMVLRMRREEARRAAARMVDWAPERVIFSHGRWFNENGAAELRRAFAWLLPSAAGPHS